MKPGMTVEFSELSPRSGDMRNLLAVLEATKDLPDEEIPAAFREVLVRAAELVLTHCAITVDLQDRRTIQTRNEAGGRSFVEGTERFATLRFFRHGQELASTTGIARI